MKYASIFCLLLSVSFTLSEMKKIERLEFDHESDVSTNFIVRWEFQKICHHIYDPRTQKQHFPTDHKGVTFDTSKVSPGDIVFVREPAKFFAEMHSHIKNPYIIVVHGQSFDGWQPCVYNFLEDDKLIAYFTIHPGEEIHPKIKILPVGIVQMPSLYKTKDELNTLFTQLRHESPKENLLYCNFLDRTNEMRRDVKGIFKNKAFCYNAKRKPFHAYINDVARSKFTLCPPGRGPDTNRTWESLLVGSIPIVESSQLNILYENLPIVIINDWEEITEEFLNNKYTEILSKKYDLRKLYVEYWVEYIESVRQNFLKTYTGSVDQSSTNESTGIFKRIYRVLKSFFVDDAK